MLLLRIRTEKSGDQCERLGADIRQGIRGEDLRDEVRMCEWIRRNTKAPRVSGGRRRRTSSTSPQSTRRRGVDLPRLGAATVGRENT